MWPAAPASADGHQPTAIELHVFVPASDGTHRSLLQEDDGTTFAATRGEHVRTTFELTRAGQQVTVVAAVDGDGYPEFARRRFELVVHGAVDDTVVIDGTRRALVAGRIELANDGNDVTVELHAR